MSSTEHWCWICHDEEAGLIEACGCVGTFQYAHRKCLLMQARRRRVCRFCKKGYNVQYDSMANDTPETVQRVVTRSPYLIVGNDGVVDTRYTVYTPERATYTLADGRQVTYIPENDHYVFESDGGHLIMLTPEFSTLQDELDQIAEHLERLGL